MKSWSKKCLVYLTLKTLHLITRCEKIDFRQTSLKKLLKMYGRNSDAITWGKEKEKMHDWTLKMLIKFDQMENKF